MCCEVSCEENGELKKFSSACLAASLSMSIAFIFMFGKRWARISETSPVPVPMSRANFAFSGTRAKVPSKTPSVPTFIAVRS